MLPTTHIRARLRRANRKRRRDAGRRDGLDTQVAATKALTIVVVEEGRDRAKAIVDALKDASNCEVFVIGNTSGLARKIAAHAPDALRTGRNQL